MNKTELKIPPKLRFAEFANAGEVCFENGDVLFQTVSNKNPDSQLPVLAITQEHGAVPREQINYNISVTDKSLDSYKLVEKGDFIISLRSFQGGIEYSEYDGICSPAYIVLRKKKNVVDVYYKYYFKTNRFIRDLNRNLEGIRDGKMVTYSQFSAILLPNPSKEEQQKTAECLKSLDELIEAENKKLVLLQKYKKGLAQKLFPGEGTNVPEWRFPEFKNGGKWLENTVENLVEAVIPPKKLGSHLYEDEGDFPIVNQSQEYICGWTNDKEAIISEELPLLVFGDHTCSLKIVSEPFAQGADGIKILSAKKDVEPEFLYQYLLNSPINSNSYKRHFSELKEKKAAFPERGSGEQQKIANCLSHTDKLIFCQLQKIDKLKEHKIGLMQGLFPEIKEVHK